MTKMAASMTAMIDVRMVLLVRLLLKNNISYCHHDCSYCRTGSASGLSSSHSSEAGGLVPFLPLEGGAHGDTPANSEGVSTLLGLGA